MDENRLLHVSYFVSNKVLTYEVSTLKSAVKSGLCNSCISSTWSKACYEPFKLQKRVKHIKKYPDKSLYNTCLTHGVISNDTFTQTNQIDIFIGESKSKQTC